MKDVECRDESERLFSQIQDRSLSEATRLRAFEQLLELTTGFWYPKGGLTLRSFMLRVARAAQANATAHGGRRDAVDEEALVHDVLLAFFVQASRIEDPRKWLVGTAYQMLRRQFGKERPLIFAVESDAPRAPQLVAPEAHASGERDEARMRQVSEAMSTSLSDRRRRVLELHLAGHTSTEIGTMLDIDPALVRQDVRRGIAILARVLQHDPQIAADMASKGGGRRGSRSAAPRKTRSSNTK